MILVLFLVYYLCVWLVCTLLFLFSFRGWQIKLHKNYMLTFLRAWFGFTQYGAQFVIWQSEVNFSHAYRGAPSDSSLGSSRGILAYEQLLGLGFFCYINLPKANSLIVLDSQNSCWKQIYNTQGFYLEISSAFHDILYAFISYSRKWKNPKFVTKQFQSRKMLRDPSYLAR